MGSMKPPRPSRLRTNIDRRTRSPRVTPEKWVDDGGRNAVTVLSPTCVEPWVKCVVTLRHVDGRDIVSKLCIKRPAKVFSRTAPGYVTNDRNLPDRVNSPIRAASENRLDRRTSERSDHPIDFALHGPLIRLHLQA